MYNTTVLSVIYRVLFFFSNKDPFTLSAELPRDWTNESANLFTAGINSTKGQKLPRCQNQNNQGWNLQILKVENAPQGAGIKVVSNQDPKNCRVPGSSSCDKDLKGDT
jgi:hypothetical protein